MSTANKQYDNRMIIVVVSCDEYSDLWDGFFKCKDLYWKDCPFQTVLVNNEKDYSKYDVKVIKCGKDAQWSDRTRVALKQLDAKYVCFMLEDFFISNNVNTDTITSILDLMESDNISYYKLDQFSKVKSKHYKDNEYIQIIDDSVKYGISLLTAIWDKEFFLEKIGDGNYNPWKFEADRNKERLQHRMTNEKICVYDNRDVLNICHMVVQGKYIPRSIKEMKHNGYNVDCSQRKSLTVFENIIYRLKVFCSNLPFGKKLIKKMLKPFGYVSVSDRNA